MKKRMTVLLIVFLTLTGCALPDTGPEPEVTPDTPEESVLFVFAPDDKNLSEEETEAYGYVDEAIQKAYDFLNRVYGKDGMRGSAAQILHSDMKAEKNTHVSFYEKATEDVRYLYSEMEKAVKNVERYSFNGRETEKGWSDLLTAEYALRMDHPEYSLYHEAGFDQDCMIPYYYLPNAGRSGKSENKEAMLRGLRVYKLAEKRVLDLLPKNASDVQKYLYFAAVLCYKCRYDRSLKSREDPFQAYDCLIRGNSICQGYAECFLRLCRMADMDCVNINNDDHIWSRVKTDEGDWYIDVTFMDQDADQEENEIALIYFLMDKEYLDSQITYKDGREYDE